MKGCKDREEALILDVFGELSPEELPEWAAHVAVCDGCRAERERLTQMMRQVKTAAVRERISAREAGHLHARVRWALNNAALAERSKTKISFWCNFLPRPAWAVGILVCLGLAAGGVAWKQVSKETTTAVSEMTAPAATAGLPAQDLEVLKNYDFLKDLDTIRKLVQVVDQNEEETAPAETLESPQPPVSSDLGKDGYA